jgi:hypothetical protein
MEWLFWFVPGVLVAVASSVLALVLNHRSPERTIRQILDRTISWIAIGLLVLTLSGCLYTLRIGCPPDDNVCDAPAMAAMGIVLLGAIAVVELLFFGIPAAFFVLKMVRRK